MKENNYRGESADSPKEIPGRGWKDVAMRVKDEFSNDHLGIVAAGVAFYFFLALFPLMSAMFSVYGLLFDPAQVEQHMSQLSSILPPQAQKIIADQLHNIATTSGQGLGLTLIFSILLSLWSANAGTKALFEGINISYNQKDERGFFKLNAISMMATFGAIIVGLIATALVIGFPALIGNLGLPDNLATTLSLARWPLLFVVVILTIAMIYKVAPDRDNPKFRWVSWGAAIAAGLWIIGSLLFSLYINNFGNYDATYGAVAAVIILLLWFQLTSVCVLLGAEINSELEHQTAKDTTVGEQRPLGQRGAYHADHVASKEGETNQKENKNNDNPELKERNQIRNLETKDRDSVERERWIRNRNRDRKPKY